MKLHKNQSGFSHIEIVLVVLVVVLIGAIGWLVYDRQNSKQSKDNTAGQSEVAGHNGDESGLGDSVAQKYLTIKEWGARFPYTGNDTLSYRMENPDFAVVISTDLATKYQCTNRGAGSIARGKAADILNPGPLTFAQAANDTRFSVGKLADYYYAFVHDQSACSENSNPTNGNEMAAAENAANDMVESIVPKVTAE